jgi:uncharacterized protein (DUF934 family)
MPRRSRRRTGWRRPLCLSNNDQIIKGREVVADDWSVLRLDEGETPESVELPAGKVIVPLAVWQAQRDELLQRADIGVWLAPDELAEARQGRPR